MKEKYTPKTMSEISLMVALLVIFVLIGCYVPILNIVIMICMPLPIIITTIKHDVSSGIIASIMGFLISSMMVGVIEGTLFFLIYSIVGIVIGKCIRNKVSASRTMIYTCLAFLVSILINILLGAFVFNDLNFVDMANEIMNTFKQSMKVYEDMGVDLKNNATYIMLNSMKVEYILNMIPSGIILTSSILSIITYKVTTLILKRINIECNKIDKFEDWYVNVWVGTSLVLLVCFSMYLKSKDIMYSDYILTTSVNVFIFVMIVSGLSTLVYYLKNKMNMTRAFIICICILVITSSFNFLLILIAVLDLFIDFRQKNPNSMRSMINKRVHKEE